MLSIKYNKSILASRRTSSGQDMLTAYGRKLWFSMFQPKSFEQLKRLMRKKIQVSLGQLFDDYNRVILLSKTFQIFPSYFTHEKIRQMLGSPHIDEYLQYIIANRSIDDVEDQELKSTLQQLRMAKGEERRIIQVYINFIKRTEDLTVNEIIMEIFDIRNPENWFKSKLVGERKFIYHHGPTNSGKTYSAINELKNLTAEQKGVYMAPLRLLAWETQQKLGKCNLVTGQEKDFQNSHLTSCTIEAVKLTQKFDVAIIDQIQLIGDLYRGWSWTTPVLGLKANKIHLCGDERALHLISRLIEKSGGQLEEKKYSRLSKLHLVRSVFKFSDIRPGDCIIEFSSSKLYKLREKINELKGTPDQPCKTAIIYGKMPPSCRKAQAQKFNNGELPYLVASDAIGMGLNLKIRRIIFTNIIKMSNERVEKVLEDHEIRQIAGRAGRGYGHGYVQCTSVDIRERVKFALRNVNITIQQNLSKEEEGNQPANNNDMEKQQMVSWNQQENEPHTGMFSTSLNRFLKDDEMRIKRAGIFFPVTIIERIKIKMERMLGRKLKTSETIKLIMHLSKENKDLYFVEVNEELLQLSDELEHLQLPFQIHYLFAQLPIPNSSTKFKQVLINFAREFKFNGEVRMPSELEENYKEGFQKYKHIHQIKLLQDQYFVAEAYTWLWNHLELYFPYNELSVKIKQSICDRMNNILNEQPRDSRREAQARFSVPEAEIVDSS